MTSRQALALRTLLAATTLILGATEVAAGPLDDRARALAEVRATAIALCPDVDRSSTAQTQTRARRVGAELPSLASRLVGVNSTASSTITSSSGVLQADLARAIQQTRECRVRVLEILVTRVLAYPAPTLAVGTTIRATTSGRPATPARARAPAPAAKRDPVVRVFLKNNLTKQDLVTLAALLPTYDIRLGRSEVDPSAAADTLFVNRDIVQPKEIVRVVEALSKLGVDVKTIQQTPVGGRREIQVGTVVDSPDPNPVQVWQDLKPLRAADLVGRTGTDFWRTAANGVAACLSTDGGMYVGGSCVLDDNARPVLRTPQ